MSLLMLSCKHASIANIKITFYYKVVLITIALTPNKEQLEEQIKVINDATEAAETLPTDLQSLKDARGTIEKLSSQSAESQVKISLYEEQSKTASLSLQTKVKEANSIVSQCEEAYRLATSTGLAGAFEHRAKELSTSINW